MDTPTAPLRCSVVMCTYNGEAHLADQLQSVVDQTRPPDEIVVRDDASTDSTYEILQEWSRLDPARVRLSRSDQNEGFLRNFERAISLATGDLVFLCDQDDLWEPRKIEAFEAVFSGHADVGMVFSDAELIDEAGQPVGLRAWKSPIVAFTAERQESWKRGNAFEDLLSCNIVTGATMAFRSKFRQLVLPFPTALGSWSLHDGWIALAISAVAEVVPLPDSYTRYRIHATQRQGLDFSRLRFWSRWAPGHVGEGGRARGNFEQVVVSLRERLIEHEAAFPVRNGLIADLDERIAHLRARGSLPGAPWSRLAAVARELRTGRYGRYSSGVRSAMADMTPRRLLR